MATKTWKIGEYCKGGIITIETSKTQISVIGKEWDMSKGCRKSSDQSKAKEWIRLDVNINDADADRKIDFFLNDLTTSYYSDEIMKWITAKTGLKKRMFYF